MSADSAFPLTTSSEQVSLILGKDFDEGSSSANSSIERVVPGSLFSRAKMFPITLVPRSSAAYLQTVAKVNHSPYLPIVP